MPRERRHDEHLLRFRRALLEMDQAAERFFLRDLELDVFEMPLRLLVAVGDTLFVPLAASVPVQPPLAVHEEAFVLDQVKVVEPPDEIDVPTNSVATGVRVLPCTDVITPTAPRWMSPVMTTRFVLPPAPSWLTKRRRASG